MIPPASSALEDPKRPMNKKIILIISEPRTGSNLLTEALKLYCPFRIINEFYLSPSGFYIRPDHIPDDLPHKKLIRDDERRELAGFLNTEQDDYISLITGIRSKPIDALRKLNELVPEHLVVKIHGFQFDELNLITLGLLDLQEIQVVLLERSSRLHSYVSNQKARQFDKWHNVDTSNIKIKIDKEDFLKEQFRSLSWYADVRHNLHIRNKSYLEVNYEKDLEFINKQSFYNLFDPWFEKIKLPVTKTDYELKYFKKQNNSSIEHSISNYDEIKDLVNN